jgi:hypothetical protein
MPLQAASRLTAAKEEERLVQQEAAEAPVKRLFRRAESGSLRAAARLG